LEYLAKDEENEVVWKSKQIVSHVGPLKPGNVDYKVSPYNLVVELETRGITSEPLQLIAADDPLNCALYANENNLLDHPGWKRIKNITKGEKFLTRIVNQAKLFSFDTSEKYKYGYAPSKNYNHAMLLDEKMEKFSGKMLWHWNCNKFMTIRLLRTKVITQRSYHQIDTIIFASLFVLTSNMMADTKQDW
jgi:hypothetical protein